MIPPKFSDFFNSLYYSNTYTSPVDLSDKALSKHLLASEDAEAANKAQQLISDPEVQRVLSEPLSYKPEKIQENNQVLTDRGFKLLSSKPVGTEKIPFYSVIEHDELNGWIIKSGAVRVPKDQFIIGPVNDKNEMALFTEEESLLRIAMAQRITKVANKANIEVIVPKKKLVAYNNLDGVTEATRKYCVVCEKINILSVDETIQAIKNMDTAHQKEVAKKIAKIVKKAGLVDASFDNIRLTPEGKLAFIDTEPAGLMVVKESNSKSASVEKCARIGLYTLMHQTSQIIRQTGNTLDVEPGLEAFREQTEKEYEKVSTPKLSKWKIALSVVSIGLIPLINVVVALIKKASFERNLDKLATLDKQMQERLPSLAEAEQIQIINEYQAKRAPLARKLFSDVVPYTPVV